MKNSKKTRKSEPRFFAANDMVVDNTTGLIWTRATLGESVKHADALTAVASCRIGGFDDWRLPTVEELFLLADRSKYNPAIDTSAFPDTKSSWYWSSSPGASSPEDFAWGVGFDDGFSDYYHRYGNAFVRAVRSAAPASAGQ